MLTLEYLHDNHLNYLALTMVLIQNKYSISSYKNLGYYFFSVFHPKVTLHNFADIIRGRELREEVQYVHVRNSDTIKW